MGWDGMGPGGVGFGSGCGATTGTADVGDARPAADAGDGAGAAAEGGAAGGPRGRGEGVPRPGGRRQEAGCESRICGLSASPTWLISSDIM